MIKHLHIQNYALIDSVDLNLSEGLSVITGETGAGKSILLGAIALLMGQRSDGKSLYDPSKKCIIEGTFALSNYPHIQAIFETEGIDFEDPCIIRREINPQGKSRTFINDSPVTLDSLKKIGQELIDIHSQQDTWWMSHPDFTLDLIDSFAQHAPLKDAYSQAFLAFQEAQKNLVLLKKQAQEGNAGLDFMQFQWDELAEAKLIPNEYETLKSAVEKGENAEQILEKMAIIANALSLDELSSLQQVRMAIQQVNALAKFDSNYANWKTRLDSLWIELKDLSQEIEQEVESLQLNPVAFVDSQKRLDNLNRLLQKHRAKNIDELIALRNDLDDKIGLYTHMDKAIADADIKSKQAFDVAQKTAVNLSQSRKSAFKPIIDKLIQSLDLLGIPNASLAMDYQEKELQANGYDKIQLLFSANKGLAPKPFKQIASGGEMSRLMLSIKHLLAEKRALPTLILDEIDTGVSGEIAIKIGQMLTQMSKGHQLIAITHLPQIAAAGTHHWYVYKNHSGEKTVSSLRVLIGEDRIDEIAKMIGGQNGYQELKENVRKLIKSNHA